MMQSYPVKTEFKATGTVDNTTGEVVDGRATMDQWLFGPCPWSRAEEYGERRMTLLEIGQHIEYCRDMENRHNWKFMVIEHFGIMSYALLDSHGTLYSILSFR